MDHVHNFVKIRHVFSELKRKVVMVELLVVDDALDLVTDPAVAFDVNDLVLDANVHCNRYIRNGRDVDNWRLLLPILFKVFLRVMIVKLQESISIKNLSIVR